MYIITLSNSETNLRRKISTQSAVTTLRFATFGTSRTWGANLSNRKQEAYPYLLQSNTTNYAIRGSDARYPSLCLQSMLKDNVYDVLIVEYDRYGKQLYPCIFDTLRRLRQRFPEATIILMNLWLLWDFDVVDQDTRVRFPAWIRASNNVKIPKEDLSTLIQAVDRTNATIEYSHHAHVSHELALQLAKHFNVHLYSWYDPSLTAREAFVKYTPYFSDFLHWNQAGHSFIASQLEQFTKNVKQPSDVIQDWTEQDQCSLWVESGTTDDATLQLHTNSPNIIMHQYDVPKGKFALEFRSSQPSSIGIYSYFPTPHPLLLTYLATYPNRLYPKMQIEIISPTTQNTSKSLIDPFENHGYPAHFPVLQEVGVVFPGLNRVTFIPTEVTEAPFRLLGFSISEVVLKNHVANATYSWFF